MGFIRVTEALGFLALLYNACFCLCFALPLTRTNTYTCPCAPDSIFAFRWFLFPGTFFQTSSKGPNKMLFRNYCCQLAAQKKNSTGCCLLEKCHQNLSFLFHWWSVVSLISHWPLIQSVCWAACGIFWDDQHGNSGMKIWHLSPAFPNVCKKKKLWQVDTWYSSCCWADSGGWEETPPAHFLWASDRKWVQKERMWARFDWRWVFKKSQWMFREVQVSLNWVTLECQLWALLGMPLEECRNECVCNDTGI